MKEINVTITIDNNESDDEKRLRLQRLAREHRMWHPRDVLTSILLLFAILCFAVSAIVMLTYSLGDGYDAGICSNFMLTFMVFGFIFFLMGHFAMPRNRKELEAKHSVPRDIYRRG